MQDLQSTLFSHGSSNGYAIRVRRNIPRIIGLIDWSSGKTTTARRVVRWLAHVAYVAVMFLIYVFWCWPWCRHNRSNDEEDDYGDGVQIPFESGQPRIRLNAEVNKCNCLSIVSFDGSERSSIINGHKQRFVYWAKRCWCNDVMSDRMVEISIHRRARIWIGHWTN